MLSMFSESAVGKDYDEQGDSEATIAADVEFLSLIQSLLNDPKVQLPLDQLLATYIEIREKHSVSDPDYNKRSLKRKIEQNVSNLKFVRPQYKSSEVAISKGGIDGAVFAAQEYNDPNENMKSIFRAAEVIRRQIL